MTQHPRTTEPSTTSYGCSLVTVTYNSRPSLEAFWANQRFSTKTQWIVVDNNSSDGSADFAERLGARVLRLNRNIGFSGANNLGMQLADHDFVGFVNPDLRVREADFLRIAEVAEERGSIVSPQLTNTDGSLQPNGRGYPLLTAKIRNRLVGNDSRYLLFGEGRQPRPVCWLMGAAIFGFREVLSRISGWDSHFFLYYEDKDLCLRAWRAGIPVLLLPDVRWEHGWRRETAHFRIPSWKRELASMAKFYGRYPEFLFGVQASRNAHPEIQRAVFGGN